MTKAQILKKIEREQNRLHKLCQRANKGLPIKRDDFTLWIGDVSELIKMYDQLKKFPKDARNIMYDRDTSQRESINSEIYDFFTEED